MGWTVDESGLHVVFSRDIPSIVRDRVRPSLLSFLDAQGTHGRGRAASRRASGRREGAGARTPRALDHPPRRSGIRATCCAIAATCRRPRACSCSRRFLDAGHRRGRSRDRGRARPGFCRVPAPARTRHDRARSRRAAPRGARRVLRRARRPARRGTRARRVATRSASNAQRGGARRRHFPLLVFLRAVPDRAHRRGYPVQRCGPARCWPAFLALDRRAVLSFYGRARR